MKPREIVEFEMNAVGLTGPTIPNADRLTLELLLDIRDLLTQIRAQTREIIITRVPPDYGKEDKLV